MLLLKTQWRPRLFWLVYGSTSETNTITLLMWEPDTLVITVRTPAKYKTTFPEFSNFRAFQEFFKFPTFSCFSSDMGTCILFDMFERIYAQIVISSSKDIRYANFLLEQKKILSDIKYLPQPSGFFFISAYQVYSSI